MAYHKPNTSVGSQFGGSTIQSTHASTNLQLILCDFLDLYLQQILYVRNIYDTTFFQRQQKYAVPVRSSRHPSLSKYIEQCIHSIEVCMKQHQPLVVVINLYESVEQESSKEGYSKDKQQSLFQPVNPPTKRILEQYRIELLYTATPSSHTRVTNGLSHAQDPNLAMQLSTDEYMELTTALGRALMLTRNLDQQLLQLPYFCTFQLLMYTTHLPVRPQPTVQSLTSSSSNNKTQTRGVSNHTTTKTQDSNFNQSITDLSKVWLLCTPNERSQYELPEDSYIVPLTHIELSYLHLRIDVRQVKDMPQVTTPAPQE